MNQELVQSGTTMVFRPIDLDLSCDSYDEPTIAQQSRNKSIFRVPNDDLVLSPLSVTRANPIRSDEEMRESEDCNERVAISPYPYSPSAEEIEERNHLMLGGMELREGLEESSRQEEMKNSNNATAGKPVDFSMYFENVPAVMHQDVDSDVDDVSFIYDDDNESILEEEGFVLEPVSPSIWDTVPTSPPRSTEEIKCQVDSRFSPAQVSVGSDSDEPPPPRSPSPLCLKK